MHKKFVLFILLGCAIAIWFAAEWLRENSHAQVQVQMSKTDKDEWFVAYGFDESVTRVTFVRNPDHSRLERWQAIDTDFYIGVDSETNEEYIARIDGLAFNSVAFQLEPTYVTLRKDYAPFSPFSDGGMSWFTGRFKVCPQSCASALRFSYDFSMEAPLSDFVRLPEQSERGQLEWQESASDGHVVYVGPQAPGPTAEHGFETIIDPILPTSLKQRLLRDVPPLTAFFNQRMPHLEERPMLLASFSPTDDGRYGYQGGVIGNQMVLHWYGHSMAERITAPYFIEDTLWFVAHEFAHLYQSGQFNNESAWIHEGAAEFMALEYLRSIHANSIYLAHRVRKAQEQCANSNDKFELHYACGLLWAAAIDEQIKREYPHGLFFLWYMYVREMAEQSFPEPVDLYFELMTQLTSESFVQEMRETIAQRFNQLPDETASPL
ncbi:hypothetical protein [Pseudidiomarina insulisalsae]|uniref:Peptidase M1 membrane alanine aminopeptidase domain-containing protein n=1 Tax=Pseudidiomarina insulisalsae TaxID=575789 RepID=A0A432YMQ2_9GAMM|nr:hypothetical protein [Pseudidiomarina insulisalsae]RUO62135.1 hypothetical protein CWI71_04600 [Pseudidiomarina insulisalsae]